MELTIDQIDSMINTLTRLKRRKEILIKEAQTKIDISYEKPVEVERPTPGVNVDQFWTKGIKSVVYFLVDYSPKCFSCLEDAVFTFEDTYGRFYMCLECGRKILERTNFPRSKITVEY